MSKSQTATQTATVVPDDRRPQFLPALFGRSLTIIGEFAVYSFMERLSPLDYRGGYWQFYEQNGKPLFLAPDSRQRFRITGDITGFGGEVRPRPPVSSPRCLPSPTSPFSTDLRCCRKATSASTLMC